MTYQFSPKLFTVLVMGFIFATVIGTLSHEFGHYAVAEGLGYDARINYGSTHFKSNGNMPDGDRFFITLGGPFQTMLTGTIGVVLLFLYRKKYGKANQLNFFQWIIIFVALFWLRQLSNLFWIAVDYLQTGKYSRRNDEIKLDRFLHLPDNTIIAITGTCAAIVLLVVILKFVPKRQRMLFTLSGLVGGLLGFYLWLHSLGKIIMP